MAADGEAVPSGRYSVIFSTHCFASLFGCAPVRPVWQVGQQGINLARQAGPKRGFSLAHPGEPCLYAGGHEDQAFDGEGAATSDLLLIGEGELKTLLHSSATAAASA